jgi:3-hydroxyacyl-CoA dehydrogenase
VVGGGVIAVAGTVVQENGPEPPEVKQQLWSAIEAVASQERCKRLRTRIPM